MFMIGIRECLGAIQYARGGFRFSGSEGIFFEDAVEHTVECA